MLQRITTVFALALFSLALLATPALAVPPKIISVEFDSVKTDSAVLRAEINPEGKATLYHFEYGPADCSANPCTSIPVPDAQFPAGAPKVVEAEVKGLTPATTYHFRVVAKNPQAEKAESPDDTFTTYVPAQQFKACPNDNLRKENPSFPPPEYSSANLPDCRVYEQASPVNKNAGDASGFVPLIKASLDGNRITFSSTTGIPGGEGSQEFPVYLATRNSSGWSTQGLLPPGNTGQIASVLGWTPDLEWVFNQSIKLGEPRKTILMARPSSGAPFQTVVDYTTELQPELAATSKDAKEVIFESQAALLPGAVAGKSNVYLWQRQSEALSLAGVLNDGNAPSQGAFAGSYDWVQGNTARGGAAAGYYTRDQNVISTDASALYFTAAGTGQLYLRKNPTQSQSPLDGGGDCTDPALACTIQVSASRKTNGKGPNNTDAAGTQPAAFLGSSPDGSVAYFTSTEKLTNDANTGPEPENPPAIARAPIDDGDPIDFKFIPTKALDVTVDGSFIYWIDPTTETIARVPIDDGDPVEDEFIPATSTDNPKGLVVDANFIYWTNAGEDIPEEGGGTSIGRAEIDGENPDEDFIPGEVEESPGVFKVLVSQPRGIDVDGSFVYWVNAGLDTGFGVGFVARAELDGDLASVEPKFIQFASVDVAVNASHVYYSYYAGELGVIRRINLDGSGSEEGVISGFPDTRGPALALDATHLYWTKTADSAIGRANLDGSSPEHEFVKEAGNPEALALDATNLYWTANQQILPNPGNDLYRYEAETDTLTDLIAVPAGTAKNGIDVQGVLATSEDGSRVYLAANGVPAGVTNSPNAGGESATPGNCKGKVGSGSGTCNLYFWQEGMVGLSFIARLDAGGGGGSDATNWAWTPSGVFPTQTFQKTALTTPDGETLLFHSRRQLSGYENEGTPQLYRYQAGDSGLSCVTCTPTGAPPSTPPQFGITLPFGTIIPPGATPQAPSSYLPKNLSADGNRVFFQSTEPLVVNDTNGNEECPEYGSFNQKFPACMDVYEWEASGSGSCEASLAYADGGCLYLLSTGVGKEPALIGATSESGNDVFFFTRDRLVGQDQDGALDVYDARANGGLASQNEPPKDPCGSEGSCRPNVSPPPPTQSPVTENPLPGNPKAKAGCPKGKHKVKGRCVKKKGKGGKAKQRKQANNRGRAGR